MIVAGLEKEAKPVMEAASTGQPVNSELKIYKL